MYAGLGKILVKNYFPVNLGRKKRLDVLINIYAIYTYSRELRLTITLHY